MTTAEALKAIRSLRDDLTVEAFGGFTGSNRCYSMAISKLDEAEIWLLKFGIESGSHLVVDKAQYREGLEATKEHDVR